MVEISRKIYEIIGAETIVDNDIILWFKEKHIEKQLDHKTLRVATAKNISQTIEKIDMNQLINQKNNANANKYMQIISSKSNY